MIRPTSTTIVRSEGRVEIGDNPEGHHNEVTAELWKEEADKIWTGLSQGA